ncbi:MAG: hypothetical protein HYZ20_17585, partial [Burkholderiales bacterium]|nr:hypothetical protein [Burkholderiales bacterium]
WRVPAALAAGVAALAGVLLLSQGRDPGSTASGWQLAEMPAAPPAALRGASPGGAAGAARSLAGSELLQVAAPTRAQMLREARVDEYLRAHRDALAGSPAALPGGAMRAVDFQLPTR